MIPAFMQHTGLSAGVRAMFADGEQCVWYDPSDRATLFQDAAGTTPVTAIEQPVGLILDKSKGLVLGAELVTNGDFSNGTTGWSVAGGATATVSAGVFVLTAGATSGGYYQDLTTTAGTVRVTLLARKVSGSSSGLVWGVPRTGSFNAPNTQVNITSASWQTISFVVRRESGAAGVRLYLQAIDGDGVFEIDNISVREIPGNHAYQSASTSRPVLSARVNLFQRTENFTHSTWVRTSGITPQNNAAVAPDGTTTANRITATAGTYHARYINQQGIYSVFGSAITFTYKVWLKSATGTTQNLSIEFIRQNTGYLNKQLAVDGVWREYEYTVSVPTPGKSLDAGLANGSAGEAFDVYVWHPDLRVANAGVNLPPYQRVTTATDYDTAGFPHYLKFDGVDDFLVTNSINFTGTDKMTVAAGVRKLSDAAYGQVVEISADWFSNSGSFALSAPFGVASNYCFVSKGTTAVSCPATYSAPHTAVLVGVGNISGDVCGLKVNGGAALTYSSDQGTGNYGNYPLYIGRRGGASLPFQGNLYSLIVRGAASSASQIASVERYINQKTKAY